MVEHSTEEEEDRVSEAVIVASDVCQRLAQSSLNEVDAEHWHVGRYVTALNEGIHLIQWLPLSIPYFYLIEPKLIC